MVDKRDHFSSAVRTRHVFDDGAVAQDEALEERGEKLPTRVRIATLPEIADPLDLHYSPGW